MRRIVPVVVALLLLAGCQRLNEQRTVDLKFGTNHRLDFTGPSYKQKIEVTVTPKDAPVSVYLIKSEDVEKVEDAVNRKKEPPKDSVLDGKTVSEKDKAESYTLTAEVPAKTPYSLFFAGPRKSTSVDVKIVGR